MKLCQYVNISELEDMINLGYIKVDYHPTAPLRIYHYTKDCYYSATWNDTTKKCRGLIVDNSDNIVAIPFKKFFNYEEYGDKSILPTTPSFEICEKIDGTLGIMYWINDIPYIATKGGFDNDQAKHASSILHNKYEGKFHLLDRGCTYLFEIVYHDDRKVINYYGTDDLYLIGIIDNTMEDVEYDIYSYCGSEVFPMKPIKYEFNDWVNIRDYVDSVNKEGFVIKFSNNFRLKLKYEEYCQMHFVKYGITRKDVFTYLKDNREDELVEMISLLEEEDRMVLNGIIDEIRGVYNNIYNICIEEKREDFETRKDAAEYIKTCTYPHVLFAMMFSGGDRYKQIIWKYAKEKIF